MATNIWKGSAPAVAQVDSLTVGGTIASGSHLSMTIGGKTYTYTTSSTNTTTIAAGIAAGWNALSATSYPEFAEITASSTGAVVKLTADTAGKPFICTVATTS